MNLEPEILEAIYTNKDNDLYSLSQSNCILLVFLRHFGCTFCREALDDIYKVKGELDARNVKPVFVHMAEDEIADEYFEQYKLPNTEHISDPDMSLYDYFGLTKGSFSQLYGLKVWFRGLKLNKQYGVDTKLPLGNLQQMPGVFMLKDSKIINSFVHNSAAERPDYLEIANCDCSE